MAELSGFPLFIADYRGYVGYEGPYEMWQFSSAGKVDGIAGNTAAGGESSKAGFFLVILPQQKKMCKILRDFAVLPAVAFQTGLQ